MLIRRMLLCVLVALGGVALPAVSDARTIIVEVAPPPPRVEVFPAPRVGHVWAPGYWVWRGHRHVWIEGHWIRERRGHHWQPHHWVEREGRWHFEEGHWERNR
jgi:WXXGXW repeat (2 copies)